MNCEWGFEPYGLHELFCCLDFRYMPVIPRTVSEKNIFRVIAVVRVILGAVKHERPATQAHAAVTHGEAVGLVYPWSTHVIIHREFVDTWAADNAI